MVKHFVAAAGTLIISSLAVIWILNTAHIVPVIIPIIFLGLSAEWGLLAWVYSAYSPIPNGPIPPFWLSVIRYVFAMLLTASITALTVSYTFLAQNPHHSSAQSTSTPSITRTVPPISQSYSSTIVTQVSSKEYIGISDGRIAFDTHRSDGSLKLQAAEKLKAGDTDGAMALWQQAAAQDSNDAEVLIYQEDQRVLASGRSYITLIIATMLSGDDSAISTGRDNLQGAYVAQKEFNDGLKLPNGVLVRLLIASSGSQTSYATTVAKQIVQLTQSDKTIVGVMGWPYSSRVHAVANILSSAHIPMVSPTATDDELTSISRYFFRVVPANKSQAILGAKYTYEVLHARKVAVFMDKSDAYSESLAQDFSQQFKAYSHANVIIVEPYQVGHPEILPNLLQDALNQQIDSIYFAGYAADVGVLLANLPTSGSFARIQVVGGDGLYQLGGYPPSARASFNRLHFTAFAYPDMWDILGYGSQKPAFFQLYGQAFDPNREHQGSPYGYTRADNDVMLSYDAMLALLQACKLGLGQGTSFTPDDLQQGLRSIADPDGAIQGVSGQISFGPDGDPTQKVVLMLLVDAVGHFKLDIVNGQPAQGCFRVNSCSNS